MPSLLAPDRLGQLSIHAHSTCELADSRQQFLQLLLKRARHLNPEDQRLLGFAFKHRLSARDIAPLVGLNHGSVVRRIRRLTARLCDPGIVALLEAGGPLSSRDRQIALAHYLRRVPLRRIARESGIPLMDVRRRLQYVRGWLTGRRDGVRVARAIRHPS